MNSTTHQMKSCKAFLTTLPSQGNVKAFDLDSDSDEDEPAAGCSARADSPPTPLGLEAVCTSPPQLHTATSTHVPLSPTTTQQTHRRGPSGSAMPGCALAVSSVSVLPAKLAQRISAARLIHATSLAAADLLPGAVCPQIAHAHTQTNAHSAGVTMATGQPPSPLASDRWVGATGGCGVDCDSGGAVLAQMLVAAPFDAVSSVPNSARLVRGGTCAKICMQEAKVIGAFVSYRR